MDLTQTDKASCSSEMHKLTMSNAGKSQGAASLR